MPLLFPQAIHSREAGVGIPFAAIFDEPDSSRLWQNFGQAPDSRTTFTVSWWARRFRLSGSSQVYHYGGDPTGALAESFRIDPANLFECSQASNAYNLVATQSFRDVTDWYHFVVTFDTTNATASERIRVYLNGTRITAFSTENYPAQNFESQMTFDAAGVERVIGANSNSGPASQFLNGILAEIVQVDGQALEPTAFGQLDGNYWVPKNYAGTYGTNGFRLDFADSDHFGRDASGAAATAENIGSTSNYWAGATGSFSFGQGAGNDITNSLANQNIRTANVYQGDFAYEVTLNQFNLGGVGMFPMAEDSTYQTSAGDGTGNLESMSRSYWIDRDGASGGRVRYGGSVQTEPAWVNGDRVKFERVGDTITVSQNGTPVHTYTQTNTEPMFLHFGSGNTLMVGGDVVNTSAGNSFIDVNLTPDHQVIDTPTNVAATLNDVLPSQPGTISNGGKNWARTGSHAVTRQTFAIPDTGKFAVAAKSVTGVSGNMIGVVAEASSLDNNVGVHVAGWASLSHLTTDGIRRESVNIDDNVSTWITPGDFCICAVDADAGRIWFGQESGGAWQWTDGNPETGAGGYDLTALSDPPPYFFAVSAENSEVSIEHDDALWPAPLPNGFLTTTKNNLPVSAVPDSSAGFSVITRTGDGTPIGSGGQVIDTLDFPPDLTWIKALSGAPASHEIFDTDRGATNSINSNTAAAQTSNPEKLASFDPNGYTVGSNGNVNGAGIDFADFNWNDAPLYGFEVSIRDGDGVAGRAVPHGLGITPSMIIVKNLDASQNWPVWLEPVSSGNIVTLNNSDTAFADNAFNGASEDINAATFSVGNDPKTNSNGAQYVDYLFASIPGFSRVGVYDANASTDGPFQYTGFKPAFFIGFTTGGTGAGRWMIDSVRSPDNPRGKESDAVVQANSSAAGFGGASYHIDFLSTGFKIRTSSDFNSAGRTIAWYCAAEAPQERARAS